MIYEPITNFKERRAKGAHTEEVRAREVEEDETRSDQGGEMPLPRFRTPIVVQEDRAGPHERDLGSPSLATVVTGSSRPRCI